MATDPLKITLKTVTPIWTGGADGKSNSLHITSIMGSLRWWYEVLVRGVGGWACDPTHPDKPKCLYDSTKPETFENVCDVCRIFGATGWARRFRLIVSEGTQLRREDPPVLKIAVPSRSYKYVDRDGKTKTKIPTWWLKSAALLGHVEVKLITTDQQFPIEVIGGLIQFIADWTAIGAKPQMGFGVVDVTPHQDTQSLVNYLQAVAGARTDNNVPTLRNMFFTSIQTSNTAIVETFNLKIDLRDLLHSSFPKNSHLRHFVMGTIKGEHQGAKIVMSRPYGNNSIRVWGWIPEGVTRFGVSREDVIKHIYTHLSKHSINYWREFNSIRDTKGQYADPQAFLQSF